jgi:hypothetical protein
MSSEVPLNTTDFKSRTLTIATKWREMKESQKDDLARNLFEKCP